MTNPEPRPSSTLHQTLRAARQALAGGDRAAARRLARQASRIDPRSEAAWLLLAATSEPRPGLAYAARALEVNPNSKAAHEAIRWLMRRLPKEERPAAAREARLPEGLPLRLAPMEAVTRRKLVSLQTMVPAFFVVAALAVWYGGQPADALQPQQASAPLAKATFTATPTNTPTNTPTATPTSTPTNTPTPTETPIPTPRPNVSFEYTHNPADLADEGRWIDVDLSEQLVTAYEGAEPVASFVVSTGTARHPTVTGQFRIWIKLRATPMSGPGYYLPGVPFTMYFYRGYALHGTYWHNNFGTPMSHGCVNLRTHEAEWLYNFASVGTLVNVHP